MESVPLEAAFAKDSESISTTWPIQTIRGTDPMTARHMRAGRPKGLSRRHLLAAAACLVSCALQGSQDPKIAQQPTGGGKRHQRPNTAGRRGDTDVAAALGPDRRDSSGNIQIFRRTGTRVLGT